MSEDHSKQFVNSCKTSPSDSQIKLQIMFQVFHSLVFFTYILFLINKNLNTSVYHTKGIHWISLIFYLYEGRIQSIVRRTLNWDLFRLKSSGRYSKCPENVTFPEPASFLVLSADKWSVKFHLPCILPLVLNPPPFVATTTAHSCPRTRTKRNACVPFFYFLTSICFSESPESCLPFWYQRWKSPQGLFFPSSLQDLCSLCASYELHYLRR